DIRFLLTDTSTTASYTLSLHDALPICRDRGEPAPAAHRGDRPLLPAPGRPRDPTRGEPRGDRRAARRRPDPAHRDLRGQRRGDRSEEHTSELQSRSDLVCRLLLEKKKQ